MKVSIKNAKMNTLDMKKVFWRTVLRDKKQYIVGPEGTQVSKQTYTQAVKGPESLVTTISDGPRVTDNPMFCH